MLETINIAMLLSAVSVCVSFLTFNRNGKKEVKQEVREDTRALIEVKTQLEYISRGIDDIKINDRVRDERISSITEDVVAMKGEIKSLAQRMNNYEKGGLSK